MARDAKGRFIKGSSGNPLGRAKPKLSAEYVEALSKRVSLSDWLEIVDKAVTLAIEGDWRARQWVSDHLVGKPVTRVEHSGPSGGPVEAEVLVIGGVDEAKMWPDGKIGGSGQ